MKKIFWLAIVVLYSFAPIDVIPDALPVVGFIDDAIVIISYLISLRRKS